MGQVPNPVTIYHPALDTTSIVDASTVQTWAGRGWTLHSTGTVEFERPSGNASRDEWARFAQRIGVPITDRMGRNEIRNAVDAVGRAATKVADHQVDETPSPRGTSTNPQEEG